MTNRSQFPSRPSGPNPPRVLLVDDDHHLLHVFAKWLNSDGFAISLACDGIEALASIESQMPDVVVVDVSMPRMDGIELAAVLKSRHIPVMLVSASLLPEHIDPDIPFLRKPFDLPQFSTAIKVLLATSD